MLERILAASAAIATIAAFVLEAWLAWKEYRSGDRKADDARRRKRR